MSTDYENIRKTQTCEQVRTAYLTDPDCHVQDPDATGCYWRVGNCHVCPLNATNPTYMRMMQTAMSKEVSKHIWEEAYKIAIKEIDTAIDYIKVE